MEPVDRRTFLKGSALAGGALLAGPFQGFAAAAPGHPKARPQQPFRSLRPVPDLRDGEVRLHLPARFQYRSFHQAGTGVVLDDGTQLPGLHDGMAAFRGPNGNVMLVRNHEINGPGGAFGDASQAYDATAGGGTTTVEVTDTGEVVRSFTSINGTMMNCSGGPMPWGSWITCEETVNGPDVGPDFNGEPNIDLEQPHGFIFEVPADGQSTRDPVTSAGRFAHEAVAFDPRHGVLYLTEDNFGFPSGLYRYVPPSNPMDTGSLANGGRLQMLAVKGQPNAELAAQQETGATYEIEWVDIDDPAPTFDYTPGEEAPTSNDEAIVYVGDQGRARGAANFSRLEGAVYDRGTVYFVSTQGGGPPEPGPGPFGYGNGFGQVWALDIASQRLRCVFQSPDQLTLDMPDNITTSPRGTLILCEDGSDDNYLRGLDRHGNLSDIALNRVHEPTDDDEQGEPLYGEEFAGSTFDPAGRTLYVNVQAEQGLTFAIWGPWGRIGV